MVRLLALARKFNFPMDLRSRRLVEQCVEHPTVATWEAAYPITLGSTGYKNATLWQAVLITDPSFPAPNLTGKKKWSRIPSQDLLIRAITSVTLQRQPPEIKRKGEA